MDTLDGLPLLAFADVRELETWLDEHQGTVAGVWLKLAKKGSGVPSPTAAEANDAALCFGWITGLRRSYDEVHYLQKITRRRPRSTWSQVNIKRVEVLTAEGRMRESGLAEVAAAEADGRWEAAYASQRDATVPTDLAAALQADTAAGKTFESLGRSEQYLVILNLLKATTPRTRAARLERMIATLAAGEKVR